MPSKTYFGDSVMSEKARLVGARIRMLRLSKNLAQNTAAEKMGISQAHLSNIEKGRSNITLENLLKLHEVLNCPMSSFFVDIDGEQPAGQEKSPLQESFTLEELLKALITVKNK